MSEIENMAKELNEFFCAGKPKEVLPLPEACNRAALTPEQQLVAFENWVAHIYARDQSTWTPQECNVIQVATLRAL
jgi:hypothetical protein